MNTKKKNKVVTYILLTIAAIIVAFPVYWMLSISFRPNGEVFGYPARLLPPTWTTASYNAVFTSPQKMTYFFNSYLDGFIVVVVSTIIGIMAGYGISRYEFKGKNIFNMFVITTQTLPQVTLLIPFFLLMVQYKLYNTRTGLVMAYSALALPYTILMMVGYYNSIPRSLDEAARIDGASDFRTMWTIITPIATPGIISTIIYTFMLSWNEYMFATTLIKDDALKTVPVGIALLKGEASYDWSLIMALSIVGSIPVLIIYLLAQRKFISGLSAGGVKG
jgi:multiple sugar transport system permease protein